MYSKKSQSELIENKDYNMVLLLPHNATKIKYFSKSFSIRFFYWLSKGTVSFLRLPLTEGYMKRLAFQSDYLSNRCDVY
jgi:hypothetical protein